MDAAQAIEALAARGDRADNDTLSDSVEVFKAWPELVDHADWLVPEDQARLHRILATNDVDVGSTNRRRRDTNHRFAGARRWLRHVFNRKPVLAFEYDSFHGFHCDCFLRPQSRAVNRLQRYSTYVNAPWSQASPDAALCFVLSDSLSTCAYRPPSRE